MSEEKKIQTITLDLTPYVSWLYKVYILPAAFYACLVSGIAYLAVAFASLNLWWFAYSGPNGHLCFFAFLGRALLACLWLGVFWGVYKETKEKAKKKPNW